MYLLILQRREAARPSIGDTSVAWLPVFGHQRRYGDEMELSARQ
jgi:hypothetical protein